MYHTIVDYYGEQTSKCGYCKGTDCSVSHGMHAVRMTVQDYQDLIDRGWRRCGHYCYKPHNKTTCCPCYTIKCDALQFQLSKSHKKVLKRMNRFLRDGKVDKTEREIANYGADDDDEHCRAADFGVAQKPSTAELKLKVAAASVEETTNSLSETPTTSQEFKHPTEPLSAGASANSVASNQSNRSLASNPPCKKAKQIRHERRQAKWESKGAVAPVHNKADINKQKSLSDYFEECRETDKHKLRLRTVHVRSGQVGVDTLNGSWKLYQKYQACIHNDPAENIREYLDFLRHSPLQHTKPQDGPDTGYGSFHQQYWLDEKLIAVGVIDILPYCVSSVYFFYDPDYSFLSLGTYGSLREIEYVQRLAAQVPSLKYYYMGYYIHSCPKMRYKGQLSPSYLLCPETYNWNLLTDFIREKLNVQKYQRFNNDSTAKDPNGFGTTDLNNVLLLISNDTCVTFGDYIRFTGEQEDSEKLIEYGNLVGKDCAHRMLYLKL